MDLVSNPTEYNITGYFSSEVIGSKLFKMPPPTFRTAFCLAPAICEPFVLFSQKPLELVTSTFASQ